jgi:hypothetical protein
VIVLIKWYVELYYLSDMEILERRQTGSMPMKIAPAARLIIHYWKLFTWVAYQ